MALSKTGRFLSKAEIVGGGGLFPPFKFYEARKERHEWSFSVAGCCEFRERVGSARGVAAIVVLCRNSSCNSSCDAIVRCGPKKYCILSAVSSAIVCLQYFM